MASVEKRERDGKARWYARYRDADGKQRSKVFDRKVDADKFVTTTAADVLRGSYLDPNAGQIRLIEYATAWLAGRPEIEETTREAVGYRFSLHVYPMLGNKKLCEIRPSTITSWLKSLDHLAPSTRRVLLANVSSVLAAAVDDDEIRKNPCKAGSVKVPVPIKHKLIPWTAGQVAAVHDNLPEQYRIIVKLGAGLGLRQGEIFGLSPDDVDFLRGTVEVKRQVKLYSSNRAAFGLPKYNKTRTVPLPPSVRDELAAHLAAYPARDVTLPWTTLDGKPTTVPLIVSTRESTALNRNYINTSIWKVALRAAGVNPTRENGMHALRHWYASVVLDAGESIRSLSEYLGHSDPGFTLRTYTQFMPESRERTRNAVDHAFSRVPDVYPAPGEAASSQISDLSV